MEKIQVPARLLSHEEQNMESGRSYFNPQSLQATLNFEDWPCEQVNDPANHKTQDGVESNRIYN